MLQVGGPRVNVDAQRDPGMPLRTRVVADRDLLPVLVLRGARRVAREAEPGEHGGDDHRQRDERDADPGAGSTADGVCVVGHEVGSVSPGTGHMDRPPPSLSADPSRKPLPHPRVAARIEQPRPSERERALAAGRRGSEVEPERGVRRIQRRARGGGSSSPPRPVPRRAAHRRAPATARTTTAASLARVAQPARQTLGSSPFERSPTLRERTVADLHDDGEQPGHGQDRGAPTTVAPAGATAAAGRDAPTRGRRRRRRAQRARRRRAGSPSRSRRERETLRTRPRPPSSRVARVHVEARAAETPERPGAVSARSGRARPASRGRGCARSGFRSASVAAAPSSARSSRRRRRAAGGRSASCQATRQ